MPKAYFEPENLDALAEVFRDAKEILQARQQDSPEIRDQVARRILEIAAKGTPPGTILREIIPMSAADAGVPDGPPDGIILMEGGDAS
jgi:hypothetical protein